MKKLLLLIAIIFISNSSFAQDEALKKDIMKVIEMSGSAAQMKVAKEQILKMIPAEKQAAFLIEFDASLPSFYEKMVKVYMELYTKEDIKAMMKYYNSPVGKKIAANAGKFTEKTQEAAKEWGEGLQGMMMKYMQ